MIAHLELTTSIGPGGWDRLTRSQRRDYLAWWHVRSAPAKSEPPKFANREDKRREFERRLAAMRGDHGDR